MIAQRTNFMDIDRAPVRHHCKCGKEVFLIFPKGAGVLVWQCSCNMIHRVDFGKAEPVFIEQLETVRLSRPPVEYTCMHCGAKNVIVLPLGSGELRWECSCKSVWLLQFQPNGGRIGLLRPGKRTDGGIILSGGAT